jgi:hypothetical protein
MNKNTKIKVTNRSTSPVGYNLPDMNNYHRQFAAGESKDLPFEEVQKLAFIPGGDFLLQHYLVIENIEARTEILGDVEIEYDFTRRDVENLLRNGSLDALLDCLDFAPEGVIDLVKEIAVATKLNDINKRQAILEKTGFNVSSAIIINEETSEVEEKAPLTRRVQVEGDKQEEAPAAPVRRQTYSLKN